MNSELRENIEKMTSKMIFSSSWIMQFWKKAMKNVRNQRDIKLITTEARKNYFISEPNSYATKMLSDNLLATKMKRSQILMNRIVYLDISILEISKKVMCEFWYDYANAKYGNKQNYTTWIQIAL